MTRQQRFRLIAIATAVGTAAPWACAESSPYYIGASQRFTHLSNVFESSTNASSDTLSTTSLTAGFDQRISRQRLFGSLTAGANRYQDHSHLNYTSYGARAGIDWETIGHLSGTLAFDANQGMGSFAPAGFGNVVSTDKDIVKSQGVQAIARIGVVTRWTGEATLSHRTTRHSNALYASRDTNVNDGSIGLRYKPSDLLALGAALRATEGKYPRYVLLAPGQFGGEGFSGRYLDLTGDWQMSGASTLSGRLSLGRNSYDTASSADYSGVTGMLRWGWKPTGKLSFTTSVMRTAGDEGSLTLVGPARDIVVATSLNRVRNTLSLEAAYEVTAKIAMHGVVSFNDGTVAFPGNPVTGSERSNSVSLGATWAPTRAIRTGCDLTRNSRSAGTMTTAYDANTFGCFGDITLR